MTELGRGRLPSLLPPCADARSIHCRVARLPPTVDFRGFSVLKRRLVRRLGGRLAYGGAVAHRRKRDEVARNDKRWPAGSGAPDAKTAFIWVSDHGGTW